MSSPIRLSVVIPAYGRPEPLKYTLRSVVRAGAHLREPFEVIVVDDGSDPPLAPQLAGFLEEMDVRVLAQRNQGSIVARLSGLDAAIGEYVLFLDSDDAVHPEKFARQLAAMHRTGADVSYTDMAEADLGADFELRDLRETRSLPVASDPADFHIRIQPPPHNPLYRRDYLRAALTKPIVPVDRAIDPVGDVWLNYNLSVRPARIVKVDGPLTVILNHEFARYSGHWEKLGLASLFLMEAFVERCPDEPATQAARAIVGERAFKAWMTLPRGFPPEFDRRLLRVWRRLPRGPLSRLGGPRFGLMARCVGPVMAGRLIRRRRAPYAQIRTLSPTELAQLRAALAGR